MDDPAKSIIGIIRADLLAWAFLGSLVAMSFWAPQDRRRAVINLAAGTCISATSAPAIYFAILWKWPTFPVEVAILGALYFWVGLFGMKLVPLIYGLIERILKDKAAGVNQ